MRVCLLLAILFVAAAVAAVAAPAEKATGSVGYSAYDVDRWIQFDAHEALANRPAKGQFYYWDELGNWYEVDVVCVNVIGTTAYFAGPVVAASDPTWLDYWLAGAVYDGGTPGRNGDAVAGVFADPHSAAFWCVNAIVAGDWFAVYDGNLVVHYND